MLKLTLPSDTADDLLDAGCRRSLSCRRHGARPAGLQAPGGRQPRRARREGRGLGAPGAAVPGVPTYFWPRPSAGRLRHRRIGSQRSSGSNLGPTKRAAPDQRPHQREGASRRPQACGRRPGPADLVYASASGLDPAQSSPESVGGSRSSRCRRPASIREDPSAGACSRGSSSSRSGDSSGECPGSTCWLPESGAGRGGAPRSPDRAPGPRPGAAISRFTYG